MHMADLERGHGRQRTRAQPLSQPLHAGGCVAIDEAQHLERW
tara:strand:+ start:391 stop:516 length:126 start_codon:yes stop_codon:yes gene_type:complete